MAPKTKEKQPSRSKPESAAPLQVNWPPLRPLVPSLDLYIDPILPNQIFLIRNFFTSSLCKNYVSFLSSLPLTTTPSRPKSKDEAVRVNDRFQIQDAEFAERLWSQTALRDLVSECRGLNDGEEDDLSGLQRQTWGGMPLGLNPNIRIYRYSPGQFFAQHYDDSNNIQFPDTSTSSKGGSIAARTTWTLLIYLTTTEGGETVFYPEDGAPPISVAPEVGMALLHRHGEHCLLHEAKQVRKGEKWVIRSDLVVPR
ncbi:hypothetical protein VTN49DRAFT_1276 [Thermomyces lanuginosus]|uniref:uncharacterized protein n=1 Tax=Thermomyces lanuginosus TaxID=5541 RepID=UPI0037428801